MDDEEQLGPEPPNMAWLLTFADLVSLLITFFVLLYSMKVVDQSRWDELNGAFQGVFAQEQAIVMIHPEDFKATQIISEFKGDSLPYLESILLAEFSRDPILQNMETYYSPGSDTLTLTLPSTLLYSVGSGSMKRTGKLAVSKLADKIRHLDNSIHVVGHTDPRPPIDESFPTNWELAMLRAVNVAEVMRERGIQKSIPAYSMGDSRYEELPQHLSELELNQRARRVEIVIRGSQDED